MDCVSRSKFAAPFLAVPFVIRSVFFFVVNWRKHSSIASRHNTIQKLLSVSVPISFEFVMLVFYDFFNVFKMLLEYTSLHTHEMFGLACQGHEMSEDERGKAATTGSGGGKYENYVVGIVESVEDVPKKSKLKVIEVMIKEDDPELNITIVTNAKHVEKGTRVVVALPGKCP